MEWPLEQLKDLFERLVRQGVYLGQACPAEHVLVMHGSGSLPQDQARLLEEHLAQCPPCREDLAALGRARDWFDQNELWILHGMAFKGARAGIIPWRGCPSAQLLYRYAYREIPATDRGKTFLAELQQHLGRCPWCVRLVESFKPAQSVRLSLRDLGANVGQAILERLREFGDALMAAAQAGGFAAAARGAPGFRGTETPTVTALLVDSQGKLVLDDSSQPLSCRFEVLQGSVKGDGFLTVDLAASDPQFFRKDDRQYEANLLIRAGQVSLQMPAAPIDAEGRSTFTGVVPQLHAMEALPLPALDVTVRPILAGG